MPAPSSRAHRRGILIFIVLLTLVQLTAIGLQFARGFRPFRRPPSRVPFSWDMFANPLERCQLIWTPPLHTPGVPLASLRQAGLRWEWDIIFDRVSAYEFFARAVCRQWGDRSAVAELNCFLPDGTEEYRAFPCAT
jgi:hypothetical protein